MDTSQETTRVELLNGIKQSNSASRTPTPLDLDDAIRWQAKMGLKTFGQSLHAAAQALFPNENRSRYSKVFVLIVGWETEPALPVSGDLSRLFGVFRDVYHFETELWKIPDSSSQHEANQKISEFVSLGGNSDDHLKILCYAGNTLKTKSHGLAWTSGYKNSKHRFPTVQWAGLQNTLEEAQSDVLCLLDCPHTGSSESYERKGVTEIISACSYTDENNGVRPGRFTKELEAELRELSNLPSFSVGNLYHNIFCRTQSDDSEEGQENIAPVYFPLSQPNPDAPRSLRLSVHETHTPRPASPGSIHSTMESVPSFQISSAMGHGQAPRIAFAIRLRDQFRIEDLSSNLFLNWLENVPAAIDGVKVEAAFHSSSSLLIVSVPICMSIYVLRDKAMTNLGPITSFNQAINRYQLPPTPNPDNWTWDRLPTPTKDMHGEPRVNGNQNSINGTSGIRFRKQCNGIPDARSDLRPNYNRGYSSQLSVASSITEEPNSLNGFDGNYESDEPQVASPEMHSDGQFNGTKSYPKIGSYSDDPHNKTFPRLSKPVELMRNSYECVVIGSGYGGGVAASRMARAGQRVCLLERGQEKWPGEYPSGFLDAAKELHVSGNFAPGALKGSNVEGGDPTGLYHLIVGKGQNAFVGNGLGGTSLLNANVFLEADNGTMNMDVWPEELRGDGKLKKYYNRAADVLQPTEYPHDWPELPKLSMLEKQAEYLGMKEKFRRVPQTTRFVGGPNSTGVEMYPSALTGMDATGVNDGSKSSTLVNYLSDAWNWGAEMFCECEVRYVRKHPDPDRGYLVFFAWHGSKRGVFKKHLYEDLMWVHAEKCVFLGAGSIGTTEILLRSKKLGLSMSDKVGTNMSGNGDLLAFGYNTDKEVNAIGRQYPSPYHPVGPTITGVIDDREGHENPLDGYVIQEGAVPKALSLLFQTMLELTPGTQHPKGDGLLEKVQDVMAKAGSRFLGPYFRKGSIERTQVYLVMSHDSNQAILTLENDQPVLEFMGVASSGHVKKLMETLAKATQAVGGTFVKNPFDGYFKQEITVHPIGGACMSKDGTAAHGVTNHFGEVLTGHGSEAHRGLVVTDGAIIPAALGCNPFATITALAERSVEHAAHDIGAKIDYTTKNYHLNLFGAPGQYKKPNGYSPRHDTFQIAQAKKLVEDTNERKANGFGFTEVMSGYIHIGDGVEGDKPEDYETAARTARGLCEEARFMLSVQAFDTNTTVRRSDHRAMLTGTFTCAGLRGSPFLVQRGDFHLFEMSQQAPGTKNLVYKFDMCSTFGEKYHFHGFKVVDSSVALGPFRFWEATSTLYVTISHAGEQGCILGRGMMHIKASDFFSEIFTLKPSGRNILARLHSTASFMGYFARQSASLFLAPLVYQQYPTVTYKGYINNTSPDRTIKITASDGVETKLQVWEPRNPRVETKNLFMIPGASVDHQIFALPTIEVNAVNYFTQAGYRVFVTVHRICQLKIAEDRWTTFDSRLDIRACFEKIRAEYGKEKVYTIAHCMGSVAYACGLLDGTIPADWVLGISCSQVFFNPIWSALNMAKVLVGPIPFDKIYKMFGGNWFSCQSTKDDSYFQQFINQLLRFYPDTRKEICNNVSCHRCSLVFGRLWNHRNLNESTHRQINRFFGGVNMTLLNTLMQMGRRGFVTTNGPLFDNLTTDENLKRLKGIPVMLFSGSDNAVLTPESTEKSYGILRDTFGAKNYERHVVQGYGHLDCWMGREAYKDVYPMVREQVDKICRGEDYRYIEHDWKNEWKNWGDLPKSG
ncbi:hypothetical protein HYFRA_00005273 [Hymenoscyphus fraxineus]|uniref:Cholesterol oxidase n=1 Tax=Hymenoscyphus fraxineus TaxID=746836 RepID=A0A9N9LDJ6_9HELO|nr:hypothetical protein HYFRA_00005273 [Hymenoscyphus fraxineus]